MRSIFSGVIHVHLFNRKAIGAEGTMQGGSQTDTDEYNKSQRRNLPSLKFKFGGWILWEPSVTQ